VSAIEPNLGIPGFASQPEARAVAAMAALGFGLRLLILAGVPTLFTPDSPSYLRIATELASQGRLEDFRLGLLRLPGYPVFLAGLLLLPLSGDLAVALGQALLGGLATGAACFVAGALGATRRASIGVALFVGAHPFYLVFGRAVMAESLALALGLGFAAAALGLRHRPYSPALATAMGLLGGALVLTRLNGLPHLLLLPLPAAIQWFRSAAHEIRTRRATLCASLAASSFLALTLPWLAWNHSHFGSWALFESSAKVRLVYAAQHGLVDVDAALERFPQDKALNDLPDPTMQLFWSLARLESRGEPEARALLREAREERPEAFRAAAAKTVLHFLGGTRGTGEVGRWLTPEPQRLWRAEARSRRYLSGESRPANSRVLRSLDQACRFYSAMRPATLLLLALTLLICVRQTKSTRSVFDLGAAALLLAHVATALLHGWTLADYERFFVPFDWVPVALFAATSLPARAASPLTTRGRLR